ncbi:MAG TPA: NIPSNAP family protein [Nevskiaceae bacterium]
MIIDLRTYTLRPGTMRRFLELYARDGRALQIRYLGEPLGHYVTEIGNVNELVHIWRYADLADRDRRRAALDADPAWLAYRKGSVDMLVQQRDAILREVDFSRFAVAGRSSEARG